MVLPMLLGNVDVPNAALSASFEASAATFLSGSDPLYSQLDGQTAELAGRAELARREYGIDLMPVAYFGIRAATEAAQHPDIAAVLPANIEQRGTVVRLCSKFMILHGVRQRIFMEHYRDSPALRPSLRKTVVREMLIDTSEEALDEGVASLGDVAIMDEAIVAGGALGLLKRKHPDALRAESAAAIVGRSVGLQLVARVPDAKLDVMREHLGAPYTNSNHLTLSHGAVDFTPQARQFLHGLVEQGEGCPAYNALTEDAHDSPTFLRMAWADLANVLLPADATTGRPAIQPKGRRRKR